MENLNLDVGELIKDYSDKLHCVIKRLWITIIILILALILTNFAWVMYELSFTETTITAEQWSDDDGWNYIIGGDSISYGNENKGENN